MTDKLKYIGGNSLLEREHVKLLLIDKISEALRAENQMSAEKARHRIGCSRRQFRFLLARQHRDLGMRKILCYCDALKIKVSFNELIGHSRSLP